jgi:hypothetical protein
MKTLDLSRLSLRQAALAVAVAAALAGCGGSSNNAAPAPVVTPPVVTPPVVVVPDISKSIADLFDYLTTLVASLSDSADPVDVNVLTLATDDTAEPSVLK